MTFSPLSLLETLNGYKAIRRYCVAYSGGLDSRVLLFAMAELRSQLTTPLVAVHVDHGLHEASGTWAETCRQDCRELNIPLTTLAVNAAAAPGQSPEAAARDARYQALAAWLGKDEYLLTAHHQDDQAETVLLQMLRGSGVHGLAGMPEQTRFGDGFHLRPLLPWSRTELQKFAIENDLSWIEDPSNEDYRFDRNRLRHGILPAIRQRWPAAGKTLARVAAHQAEAAYLLDEIADNDVTNSTGDVAGTLSVSKLRELGISRRRNVLRYWLRRKKLAIPSYAVLKQVEKDLLLAAWDRTPRVIWDGAEVRRYRDGIYAFKPLPSHDINQSYIWEPDQALDLATAGGVLRANQIIGKGLRLQSCDKALVVRFRRGGERCCPTGRQHHHRLKHLFQETGIPPWERDRTPLIYIGDELAAVAGLWVCQPFQASGEEAGLKIEWQRPV